MDLKELPLNSNEWSTKNGIPYIDFSHMFKTCKNEPTVCFYVISYCICLLIPAIIILCIPTISDDWQVGVIIYTLFLLGFIIWLYFFVEWVTGPINTHRIYELFNMRTKFILYLLVTFILLILLLSHFFDYLSILIIIFFLVLLLLLFSGIYKLFLLLYSLKIINSIILILPFFAIIIAIFLLVYKNNQIMDGLILSNKY